MDLNEAESELVLDALADYERSCGAVGSPPGSRYTTWVTELRQRMLADHRERFRDDHEPTFVETLAKAEADGRAAGRVVMRAQLVAAAAAHGALAGMAEAYQEARPEPEPDGVTCAECGATIQRLAPTAEPTSEAARVWASTSTGGTTCDGITPHAPEKPEPDEDDGPEPEPVAREARRAGGDLALQFVRAGVQLGRAQVAREQREAESDDEDPERQCGSESAEGTRCELSMIPGVHGGGRAGEPCHRGFNRGGVEVTWAAGNRQHERPLRDGEVICRRCGDRLVSGGILATGQRISARTRQPLCEGEPHVPVRSEPWEPEPVGHEPAPRHAHGAPEVWGAELAQELSGRVRAELDLEGAAAAVEAAAHELHRERDRVNAERDTAPTS